MKKILQKALILFLLLTNLNSLTAFADFSDLSSFHPNYRSIVYLQEKGILNGYPDGSFKPDITVNRAEFLKIIMEGSNIDLDVLASTPFPDIDNNQWYGPYVKKAYKEGWINGYPDGSFKPEQTINKVESLKILGKVQNWQLSTIKDKPFNDTPLSEWFTPYVSYAKEQELLEETGPIFSPSSLMSRAKISEIIYRTETSLPADKTSLPSNSATDNDILDDDILNIPPQSPTDIGNSVAINNSSLPAYNFQLTAKNFYDHVSLDEELPNIFYKNEIYYLEGDLDSSSYKKATVILESKDSEDKHTFSGKVIDKHFSIPVYFNTPGTYILGIIPGESGVSTAIGISVLNELPTSGSTDIGNGSVSNQKISFDADNTYLEFNANPNTLKKISFTQDSNQVTYFSRQNKTQISLNYADFANFKEGDVNYNISIAHASSIKPLTIASAFKSTPSQNFNATSHQFSQIEEEEIKASPPVILNNISTISFSGNALTDLKQDAYVIKANGLVENVKLSTNSPTYSYLNKSIISKGGSFSYSFTPNTAGTYIVEINNQNGVPSLNFAVYVATGIPLLPDYFDLTQRSAFKGNLNLQNARQELISLINRSRSEYGLKSIDLSEELNNIAQSHSQDMADNNYFSHVNLQGKTPDARRLAAGIKTSISENLAKDTSIEDAHNGLMRSASHRSNLLTPDWERVGLGIVEKDGQLFISEEFSIFEITEAKLLEIKNELINSVNNKRISAGVGTLNLNENISSASSFINNQVINENQEITQNIFTSALSQFNVTGSSQLLGRIFDSGNWTETLNSLMEDETTIVDSTWLFFGIDMKVDSTGDLHTILILNKN